MSRPRRNFDLQPWPVDGECRACGSIAVTTDDLCTWCRDRLETALYADFCPRDRRRPDPSEMEPPYAVRADWALDLDELNYPLL